MSAIPSLFRWEPAMVLEGGAVVVAVGPLIFVHDGRSCWEVLPTFARPNMSHAGTRGLVLGQVRAALGDPHAYIRAIKTPQGRRWRFSSTSYSPSISWFAEGPCLWDVVERLSRKRDAEAGRG